MSDANIDLKSNKKVLRCVYGKGNKYYLQPAKDPKTGRFPECVRPVDDKGNILLTEKERELENSGTKHFIAQNEVIEVEDNTTFDMSDPYDRARWEAIEHSSYIAKEGRGAKDSKGTLIIDGDIRKDNLELLTNRRTSTHSGLADLYVEIPGEMTRKVVDKAKLKYTAVGYIFNDEKGVEGRLLKARLLGRNLKNQPDDSVQQYLLQIAEKDPQRIIDLYENADLGLKMLILDAKEKNIIEYKNKSYYYGDTLISGSDEGLFTALKSDSFASVLKNIRRDTYPDLELNNKKSKN